MTASSFFLEGYTVSHFLAGSSVIFQGCRDLSPEAIRLPRGIKHIMFDTADCGTKIKLPDFSARLRGGEERSVRKQRRKRLVLRKHLADLLRRNAPAGNEDAL